MKKIKNKPLFITINHFEFLSPNDEEFFDFTYQATSSIEIVQKVKIKPPI
jgi:hypothetical protein